jgi:hypothetical protein
MNPEIEHLIDMALADGNVTDKERGIILRKAEAMGFDVDEVEMILDGKLALARKQNSNQSTGLSSNNKVGDVKKCPSCGSPAQSFITQCSDCGHEFSNIEVNASIQKLFEMLNEAEDMRAEDVDTTNPLKAMGSFYAKSFSSLTGPGKVDKKKMEIISNFPIPTTKEDILEFLSLALPKAKLVGNFLTKNSNENRPHNEFVQVWKTKCEQVIMKARFSLKDDKKTLEEINSYAKEIGIK